MFSLPMNLKPTSIEAKWTEENCSIILRSTQVTGNGYLNCKLEHPLTKPARQAGADGGKFKDISVEEVPRIESGPLVVKSKEYAQELRGPSYRSGIEMEAVGFIKALDLCEKQGKHNTPTFALVKGVSDLGRGKSGKAETNFFGMKTAALSDGERQQVATLHSIALVIRGVIQRYLIPHPVVNPREL